VALRIALVGGPLYEPLNRTLRRSGIDVLELPDVPIAQRRVAAMLSAGERLDLVTTSSAQIASLSRWLLPLEQMVSIDGLSARAAGLCTWGGHLYALPRSIEVRLLWARRDLVVDVPASWNELDAGGATFGFVGRGPHLFHTFVEAYVGVGGRLVDDDGAPSYATARAAAAIALLVRLGRRRAPNDLPTWRWDDLDNALAAGRVAMAQVGSSGWARLRRSPFRDRFALRPALNGTSHGACLCWAIPATCGDPPGALALLNEVTGVDANLADLSTGLLPARLDVIDRFEHADPVEAQRLALLRQVASGLIAPPPHPHLPGFEETAWRVLNRALRGELQPGDAAAALQQSAHRVLG
jgi:multiple sugar transport system substrate-binding protein